MVAADQTGSNVLVDVKVPWWAGRLKVSVQEGAPVEVHLMYRAAETNCSFYQVPLGSTGSYSLLGVEFIQIYSSGVSVIAHTFHFL